MLLEILFFVLGLIFGSFISALTFRIPKKISISSGRSFCPNCKHQISWFDNIPLISFMLLMGRCRSCGKKISWRYPLIEASTGIGFLLIFLHFAPALVTTIFFLFTYCILIILFVIDFEHKLLPDTFIFTGIVIFTIYLYLFSHENVLSGLFAGFLSAAFLMFVHLVTKGRGMGLGDVKFAVLGGMIIGLKFTFVWLFLSFLTGGIVGIILIIGKLAKLKDQIAFGPFLITGLIGAFIWGEKILALLSLN